MVGGTLGRKGRREQHSGALGLAVHTEDHLTYDTLHRADEDGQWVHPSPSGSSEPDDGILCGQLTRARPTLRKSTG